MFRYLSSTLPPFPPKPDVCTVLLLSSSSAPPNSWQLEDDFPRIQEALTEGAGDTLDSLLDWCEQCDRQRTEQDATHHNSAFDYEFEEYEGRQKAPPPQGWPVPESVALQGRIGSRKNGTEDGSKAYRDSTFDDHVVENEARHDTSPLQSWSVHSFPVPILPEPSENWTEDLDLRKELEEFIILPSKLVRPNRSQSPAVVDPPPPITADPASDDRPTLVAASSSRECKFAGLGDVNQCTSIEHSFLASQLGSKAMEEAAAGTASALEGCSDNVDPTVCKKRRFNWPTQWYEDEGVQLVNRTLFKMNGEQTMLNQREREMVRQILRFALRKIRVHKKDHLERQRLYARMKDWAKKWENCSLEFNGRECEVEFYSEVAQISKFCRHWFATCKDKYSLTMRRLTEIMEMEEWILEINRILREKESPMFEDFQVKVSRRFCKETIAPQANRVLALIVMRNFAHRLLKVLSAEMGAEVVTTEEERQEFLKACLDLLERILTNMEVELPSCPHRTCKDDRCVPARMWLEVLSSPRQTQSDNLYIRAFEQLLSPHVAKKIRTDLLAQSKQNRALTRALREWMKTNVGERSFTEEKFAEIIERVATVKQTSLKRWKSKLRVVTNSA